MLEAVEESHPMLQAMPLRATRVAARYVSCRPCTHTIIYMYMKNIFRARSEMCKFKSFFTITRNQYFILVLVTLSTTCGFCTETKVHDETLSGIISSEELKHFEEYEKSAWKTVLSNERRRKASQFRFTDNKASPVSLPFESITAVPRIPLNNIESRPKALWDALKIDKAKSHRKMRGKWRRLKKNPKSSRPHSKTSNSRQKTFRSYHSDNLHGNSAHEFTKKLENEIIQSHFSTTLINSASHKNDYAEFDSISNDLFASQSEMKNYETLNNSIEPSIVGDLSCMQENFFPAPSIPHALIKYVKSSEPGHEYLEADYECISGYILFSNISRLVCRNRKWIGILPSCIIRETLDLCYHSSCDQICSEVNGRKKCFCYQGFQLQENECIDVNECDNNNGGCQYLCVNTPGSFQCDCPTGMTYGDDKFTCIDIDECLLNNGRGSCQDTCQNYIGGYVCLCNGIPGTILSSDNHTCQDVGPCAVDNAGCSHTCLSTIGRTFCLCPDGFMLQDDWKTCQDIDECSVPDLQTEVCRFGCINTPGSYRCADPIQLNDQPIENFVSNVCPPGYQALSSRSSCVDINECENNNGGCIEVCENTDGNYFCACEGDEKILSSDGKSCTDINSVACPPLLSPTKKGTLICSRPNAKNEWSPDRAVNRPDTKCYLKCPKGHHLIGEYQLTCRSDGNWIGTRTGNCIKSGKPRIKCPEDIITELPPNHDETFVKFDQPWTNLDWFRYVDSQPSWGMRLEANLKSGLHAINFHVTDPISKIRASCTVRIIVQDGEPPKVHNCPKDIVGINGTSIIWKEPIFTDNIKVTRITSNESPGRSFDIGEWQIFYQANDDAGWFENCTFHIFVK